MKHSNLERQGERGQSLTELALLMPLLLVMLVGVLDVARAYDAYLSLTNAAREGARYGAAHPKDSIGIGIHVNNELNGTGITGVSVTVDCLSYADDTVSKVCDPTDPNGVQNGDRVRVTVNAPFQFFSLNVIRLTAITLHNTATMAVMLP